MEHHRIGQPFEERPEIFELVIEDFVWTIDPKDYGLNLPVIDPSKMFVTSGDAIRKVEALENKYLEFADAITVAGTKTQIKNLQALQKLAFEMAGRSRSLINKLKYAKGGACFLETEWSPSHALYVIPKNPRAISAKAKEVAKETAKK